ncbi:MAG: hypothetical protein Q7V01_07995 [Vicinamibacterales bacterium]|nr:hypothetical protein [Vicinamibacterales bacterium]
MRWLVVFGMALLSASCQSGTGPQDASSGTGSKPLAGNPVPAAERPAPAPATPAPPVLAASMGGWTRVGDVQRFGPGTLWEYINGGAEQYLSFGFQDLESAKYGRPEGATVVVDAYRMADRLHAFGIYAQESSPRRKPVKVGVAGRAGTAALEFWATSYYVKLVADPGKPVTPDDLAALARAVATGLGDAGGLPPELALVPDRGLVPGSIRFVPEDALGQASFGSALEAQYEGAPTPSTLLLIPFESPASATEALAAYGTFLAQGGVAPRSLPALAPGGFSTTERYYGRLVAARSGRWLIVSLGADTDEAAESLVRAAAARVASGSASEG